MCDINNAILETQCLSNIPGYVDNIKKIDLEEDWEAAKEYDPYGEWE